MNADKDNLLNALIEARIDSRRRLVKAILDGRVTVNGEVITVLRKPVNRKADSIRLDGKEIKQGTEKYIYLLLNKPAGVLSTVSDERGRPTVLDILPEKYKGMRLYPAGRLDKDTTGLMLLTNDGELTHKLTHPSFNLEKEYYAQTDSVLTANERKQLESGIRLDDGITAPAKVEKLKNALPYNYSITIHEGRKRQVRRMFAALGHATLALKRMRIGNIELGKLKEGEVREVVNNEIVLLKKR